MTDLAALQRLLTWLSPAFPVGSFAWSQGLETAIGDGRITVAADLKDWIGGMLAHGGLRTDAIILGHAYRGAGDAAVLQELADLALSIAGTMEDAGRRSRMEGYCWAHLAHARRAANDPAGAEEASDRAWSLWRAGAGDDPGLLEEARVAALAGR